jgi:acyl dehydratase
MPINTEQLLNYQIPEARQYLTERDTILYAFSIGMGQDPMDQRQLDFLDHHRALRAVPSLAVVLARGPTFSRDKATGIDPVHVVHGEQGFVIHHKLPVKGEIIGRSRITGLIDKGEGKGALIYTEKTLTDASGTLLATLTSTTFARANGGFGGPSGPLKPVHKVPERAPDLTVDLATRPEQALVYRLNGDDNPLHADPEFAARAGFPRPILHGLCTLGVVTHALLRELCDYDPTRLRGLDLRFSSPVFPGETIRTEIWREAGGTAAFRARLVERDVVVVNNGRAVLAP